MEMSQILAVEQLKYRLPIWAIVKRLEEYGIIPESPIQGHPIYPDGFEVVFVLKNEVYTVTMGGNEAVRLDIFKEPFQGYYPSGALIRTNGRKIVWT